MASTPTTDLINELKAQWPSTVAGKDGWQLLLISSLITLHKSTEAGHVVHHIASALPDTKAQRHFFTRIKDALMKLSQIVGIPLVIIALSEMVKVEKAINLPVLSREEQVQQSHYADLETTAALDSRGEEHMRLLYEHNLEPIMSTWDSHQVDFEWLEKRVIYGLFLSDFAVLDVVETEIVILSGIMCQGLNMPSMWHVRGLRRLGVSVEDAEAVCESIKTVARWAGKDTSGWLKARDVDISS